MPVGIQRLNAGNSHPNDRIVFIKPLPGPDEKTALDFLNRVAAICAPIMRSAHLSVMSLEEFEPNREFVGRNFNAGEVIQLVLKAPGSNRWLPFQYVQMVMMHELAHCTQMNHSRAFWAVRNQYADELRGLWSKSYTGDGFWGRGQRLYDGQYSLDALPASDYMPENLCGGTYRSSRSRKRKRNDKQPTKLSYAERKQRRLAKKFGKDWETAGRVLGEDEVLRWGLERGKRVTGNPRVAKSKRGRELRAAAALARLDQANDEKQRAESRDQSEKDDTSDTDDDSDADSLDSRQEATDADGSRLLDAKGRGMVKVCEDEDAKDQDAKQEMKELSDIREYLTKPANDTNKARQDPQTAQKDSDSTTEAATARNGRRNVSKSLPQERNKSTPPSAPLEQDGSTTEDEADSFNALRPVPKTTQSSRQHAKQNQSASTQPPDPVKHPPASSTVGSTATLRLRPPLESTSASAAEQVCAACSFSNAPDALICAVCAHVLDTERLPRFWRCVSEACNGGMYVNAEDVGICGICGASKPAI